MRGKPDEFEFGCILFHYVPDQPFSYLITPMFSGTTDTSKHLPPDKPGCRDPEIDDFLHPVWYRHCPNIPGLSNEINDGPMFFPLL